MFESASHARVGAFARAVEAKRRHRSPSELALVALQAMFIAITVASFAAWSAPSRSHRSDISGFGPESDCASFGRGGVYCSGTSAIDDRSNRSSGSDEDCISLGRGGLLCKERLGNADGPT